MDGCKRVRALTEAPRRIGVARPELSAIGLTPARVATSIPKGDECGGVRGSSATEREGGDGTATGTTTGGGGGGGAGAAGAAGAGWRARSRAARSAASTADWTAWAI